MIRRASVAILLVGLLASVAAAQTEPTSETKRWIIPLRYAPAPETADVLAEFAQRKKLRAELKSDEPSNIVILDADEEIYLVIKVEANRLDSYVPSVELDLLLLEVPAELTERVVGTEGGRALTVRGARLLMAAVCDAKERGDAKLLSHDKFNLGDSKVAEFNVSKPSVGPVGRLKPFLGCPMDGLDLEVEFVDVAPGGRKTGVVVEQMPYNGIAVFRVPRPTADDGRKGDVIAVVVVKPFDEDDRE